MLWLIIGASEGMIILWLMIEVMRAPNGYQDESGFHEIKKGQECLPKMPGESWTGRKPGFRMIGADRSRLLARKPRLNSM